MQEVLQGIRDPAAHAVVREAMLALPMVESPMPLAVYLEAADLFRTARRAGFTVRSSVDCLIAACAQRHSLAVLHRDRDFDALAKVAAIEVGIIQPGCLTSRARNTAAIPPAPSSRSIS
ncbi:MAG: PIN domain-containing protein [Acidobacteria bacterium]|nr:PIN domain-containing protein [Acidobacteriota bacterium]